MLAFGVLTLSAIPLVLQLPLEADLHETLPADMVQAMERRARLFGAYDLAFLLVQTQQGAPEELIAFGEALTQQLSASPLIRSVEFGYAPALFEALHEVTLDYAPLFVSAEHLETFDQLLTPQGIQTQIRKTLLALSTIGASIQDNLLQEDPLQLRRFAFARLMALRGSFRFDPLSPYFLSQDRTALLIKVEGQASVDDMAGVKATMALLQQVLQHLLSQPAFRGLTVQGTGGYYLAAESEKVIRGDLIQSINLAVVLICLLVAWTFRRWSVLLYGQLPTLGGLLMALGAFALFRPRLNALTLGCAAALVGLGIDFTIHLLTQCFTELGKGRTKQEAIRRSVRETGEGLFLAAATTIAAFGAFLFAEQHFLQDMGLLAALGIFWCFLLSLTILPALLTWLATTKESLPPRTMGMPALLALALKAPAVVLGLSLFLCLGALAALVMWPPSFETDLRNIHAADSPALQTQTKIATIFGGSQEPLIVLLEGPTETQVVQAMYQLQPALTTMVSEGLLAAVTSLAAIYPDLESQEAVLQRLRSKDPDTLVQVLATSLEAAGFDVTAFTDYMQRMHQALSLRTSLDLATFKSLGFNDLVRPFVGRDAAGAAGLVVLYPKKDLWTLADRNALSQRVTSLLDRFGLHGTLTGLYTVSSESAARIGADFRRITLLAVVCIGLVICLRFRHLRRVGLVFLPVACGTLWTAGFFALFGLRLNFMNIAILPMLLGIGIDNGIHIVHRFHLPGTRQVQDALQCTSTAICLSSFTTLLAFGTLALSVNQGIASVGFVSLTGVMACLLASLFTLPAALKVWEEKRTGDV
jgi:hypothetical protein